MTKLDSLRDRNRHYADGTDPALFLELDFADAVVARTVGGRITDAVLQDLADIGYLVERKADAEALAAGIPAARLRLIGGAGHLTNVETPERFRAELRDFLTG